MAKKPTSGSVLDNLRSSIQQQREEIRRSVNEAETFRGARKEWNKNIAKKEQEISIETLLSDSYYLGARNIWPSIRGEIEDIWHRRCDFSVTLRQQGQITKTDTIYALSHEHAKRRTMEKWPRLTNEADRLDVRRAHEIHTVVIECPKGTGKDFEMALIIWLLVREFLIQDRLDFFAAYNLDLDTTISINCVNRSEIQAKAVTFKELLPKFNTPFFNDYFPPQVDVREVMNARIMPSELRFPRNIVVFPGTGSASSGLGYTLGSAVIDEANFLEKTEGTKQSIQGDSYDAAQEIYDDALQRHFSRFGTIRHGAMSVAGLIVCISSSRTTSDFTQKMERRAEKDPGIYYSSSTFWQRKPLPLCGQTFKFDIANMQVLEEAVAKKQLGDLRQHGQIALDEAQAVAH